MKEILQVKMDLAFHFYPFTELGRFELLDYSNDSRQFMFSEFPHSPLMWYGLLSWPALSSTAI